MRLSTWQGSLVLALVSTMVTMVSVWSSPDMPTLFAFAPILTWLALVALLFIAAIVVKTWHAISGAYWRRRMKRLYDADWRNDL